MKWVTKDYNKYTILWGEFILIGNLDKGIEYIMKVEDAADAEGDNTILIIVLL